MKVDLNTPVAMLTVGQLKEALRGDEPSKEVLNTSGNEKKVCVWDCRDSPTIQL